MFTRDLSKESALERGVKRHNAFHFSRKSSALLILVFFFFVASLFFTLSFIPQLNVLLFFRYLWLFLMILFLLFIFIISLIPSKKTFWSLRYSPIDIKEVKGKKFRRKYLK